MKIDASTGKSSPLGATIVSGVPPYLLRTSETPNGVPQEVFDQIAGGLTADRFAFHFQERLVILSINKNITGGQIDLSHITERCFSRPPEEIEFRFGLSALAEQWRVGQSETASHQNQ